MKSSGELPVLAGIPWIARIAGMIGLAGRIHARESARFHVQIQLEKNPGGFVVPDEVKIRGRVVRAFRGTGELSLGDSVSFMLWICGHGDEPTGPAFVYEDDFARATHMEVYLTGNPPECQLAAYEFKTLSAPTDEPTMSVQELRIPQAPTVSLEEPNRKRTFDKGWWQFWKTRETRPPDWIAKYREPYFRTRKEAEKYVADELRRAIPEGWRLVQSSEEALSWLIQKTRPEPGEADAVDYCVQVSRSLDLIVLTYGNTDAGIFSLTHALQNGLVMETAMLRKFSLGECLGFLFSRCEPNRRCFT